MRRTLFITGLILAIMAAAIAAFMKYQNAQAAVSTPLVKPITVPVSRGDVVKTVTAPGQLVGIQEKLLGVDVNGRLLELSVSPGSIVQTGDVIAQLDPVPYETALQTAQF